MTCHLHPTTTPPTTRYQCTKFVGDASIPLADYQALLHDSCLRHELAHLKAAGADFSMWLYCPEVRVVSPVLCWRVIIACYITRAPDASNHSSAYRTLHRNECPTAVLETLLGVTCPLLICCDHAYKNFFNALLNSVAIRDQPGSLRAIMRQCLVEAHTALRNENELSMLNGHGDHQNSNAARFVLYNEEVLTYLENKAHADAIEYEVLLGQDDGVEFDVDGDAEFAERVEARALASPEVAS